MYMQNKMPSYNGLGQTDNIFNPPAYYQSMATDPSQVPVQTYPGYPLTYGYPGAYGPWPGFYLGQRTITAEEADRIAKERQQFMERRAATSDEPEHKYLRAEGSLNPGLQRLLKAAQVESKKKKEVDVVGKLQKKIITTVIIGAVLSALLK